MFWGCSGNQGLRHRPASPPPAQTGSIRPPLPEISDWGWRERLVTEDELNQLELADPNLNPSATHRILARLNGKADYYIYEDIRKSRPLRVPNDFRAYSGWTPLPRQTDHLAHLSKAILVVKDFPYRLVRAREVGGRFSGESGKTGRGNRGRGLPDPRQSGRQVLSQLP